MVYLVLGRAILGRPESLVLVAVDTHAGDVGVQAN